MAGLAPGLAHARVPPEVEAALAAERVPMQAVAIVVHDVSQVTPIISWQAERPMNPASLMKLLPTLAGLELLGPAHVWTTPVWLTGPIRGDGLEGGLVIKGSGDPRLMSDRLAALFRRLQQLGVREIRGDIVLDRSAFAIAEQPAGDFDGEPHRPYNANADALLLNHRAVMLSVWPDAGSGQAWISVEPSLAGMEVTPSVPLVAGPCGDWRTALKADFTDPSRMSLAGGFALACGERHWPVAPADPAGFNARLIEALWRAQGGIVSGRVRDGVAPDGPASFELVSPALAEVVRDINKYSNNVMAQQLFLSLALAPGRPATVSGARDTLQQWAKQRLGSGATRGLVIDNGSGLSREARASAGLLARLLVHAWASPVMPEFMASLPLAGLDGTSRRLRSLEGRAHLKTGSLRDVAAIAGYVHAASGRRYAVVAIANHPHASAARPAFERLLLGLVNDRGPSLRPGSDPDLSPGGFPAEASLPSLPP